MINMKQKASEWTLKDVLEGNEKNMSKKRNDFVTAGVRISCSKKILL